MSSLVSLYDRLVALATSRWFEGLALLFTRVAFAGIFWRSGRSKVEEGSWLEISDTTYFLFENEYAGVPIPADFAAPMATYAEHTFPILLVLGLATRFSALSLLGMTLVIQFFVYPEAWWAVHILWVAMALVLIARGAGIFSLHHAIAKVRGQ
ncbi:DoxX family protein [Altererythrobacter arenosus]|uniref:DoxX family protein n=1 Tax=Altererythrobacter arenosus TaxID=3032592 RepID=A0ABY8FM31_9SPHN|nr:DoxX family protein [Altererythrobacter sp. CAU 1644]WFL76078.1 DoxX family protein [Altererythrobacter sp. CAU 1644]